MQCNAMQRRTAKCFEHFVVPFVKRKLRVGVGAQVAAQNLLAPAVGVHLEEDTRGAVHQQVAVLADDHVGQPILDERQRGQRNEDVNKEYANMCDQST